MWCCLPSLLSLHLHWRCAGPNLDGQSVYNMLQDFQVNGTAGVPTVYLGLMDYMSASSGRKLNHLKMAIVGGASCPQKIFDAFNRCFNGLCPSLTPAAQYGCPQRNLLLSAAMEHHHHGTSIVTLMHAQHLNVLSAVVNTGDNLTSCADAWAKLLP